MKTPAIVLVCIVGITVYAADVKNTEGKLPPNYERPASFQWAVVPGEFLPDGKTPLRAPTVTNSTGKRVVAVRYVNGWRVPKDAEEEKKEIQKYKQRQQARLVSPTPSNTEPAK